MYILTHTHIYINKEKIYTYMCIYIIKRKKKVEGTILHIQIQNL